MSPTRLLLAAALLTSLAGALACGTDEDEAPSCRVDADCASGRCGSEGACIPNDGQGGDGGAGGSATGGDGGGTGGSGTCLPDRDGTITRAEVPLQAGLFATFRVGQNATIDTAGEAAPDGARTWDLTGALPGDHGVRVELLPIDGQWFAASFPGASYATRLSESAELLGVFEITPDALLLRGVVSPEDGLFKTELTYEPAVKVLSFPLTSGTTFTTDATVTGTAQGAFSFYSESYESTVDAHGTLRTPFADFPVLRVRTVLTRTVAGFPTTIRTFAFASECFGTVATITSQDYETAQEFTDAAEVRRLAP